jgi:hypothetical protein
MELLYRHTQFGWVILGTLAGAALVAGPRLPTADGGLGRSLFFGILALVALLFGTLTVEVDGEAIRLRFGIGLIRKRIPLAAVRSWREVRNSWFFGWGIRVIPGGMLWNVSGLGAVELELDSGRLFRIGTDEPAALAEVIGRVVGQPPSERRHAPAAATPRLGAGALVLVVVGLALVGGCFYLQLQPPTVTVSPHQISVHALFYGQDYPMVDVTHVSLEAALPCIRTRTNGFAGGGILRGNFVVEGLGKGKLFVEQGCSPYVLIRMQSGFVIVNFRESAKTIALFDEIRRHWNPR